MNQRFTLLGILACCAGCSATSPALPEAQSLLAQGKLEEAAARFELVCGQAPLSEGCAAADAKAAEARLKLSGQLIEGGKYLAAEKQALLALGRGDDATRAKAKELLEGEECKQGLLLERASLDLSPSSAMPVMEKIAAGSTKAAPLAKKWLETNRPAMALATAKVACGPSHRGSCSKAWDAVQAAGLQGAEVDEVKSLAEAEQKRIKPLRAQAESFLAAFADRKKKQDAFKKCTQEKPDGADQCRVDVYNDQGDDPFKTRLLSWQNTDKLFRKLLKNIADPAIVEELNARRAQALQTGEVPKAGGKP